MGRTTRLLLATVAVIMVAAGPLISKASAKPTEAVLEVYVENTEWSPAASWPPEHESLGIIEPVWWTSLVGRGDIAPSGGGVPSGGMSIEQLAQMSHVPREELATIYVKNEEGESFSLGRAEALGGATEAPYIYAEGGTSATSAISFVAPERDLHGRRTSSGLCGALELVFVIEGAFLELSPLAVSPMEPVAGTPVRFGQPHLSGGAQPGAPYPEYRWDFGDGETSDEPEPSHIYQAGASPVTYYEASVEVVVRNYKKELEGSAERTITVEVKNPAAPTPEVNEVVPIPMEPTTVVGPLPSPGAAVRPGSTSGAVTPTGRRPSGDEGGGRIRPKSGHVGASPHVAAGRGAGRARVTHSGGKAGVQGIGRAGLGTGTGTGEEGARTGRGPVGRSGPGSRTARNGQDHRVSHQASHTSKHPSSRRPTATQKAPTVAADEKPSAMVGVLLESAVGVLPSRSPAGGGSAGASAVTLQQTHPRAMASTRALGILGLVVGIAATVVAVLLGALGELRMGRFVRSSFESATDRP